MNTEETSRNHWQWLGILVTIGPVVGYLMAFLREWGYCTFFGIPSSFIRLDTTNILLGVGEGLGLALVGLFCVAIYHEVKSEPTSKVSGPLRQRLWLILSLFAISFYLVFRYGLPLYLLASCFAAAFVFLLLEFSVVVTKYRNVKGWRAKYEEQDKPIPKDITRDFLQQRFGRGVYIIIFFAFFLLLGAYLGGFLPASTQKDFLVPSTNPNTVVLRVYGDNLICAHLANETKGNKTNVVVEKSFFILKLDDEPRPILNLTRVGPLTRSTN